MSRSLKDLHPRVQSRFESFLQELTELTGLSIGTSCTYRNEIEQEREVEKGTSQAQFPYSWHNHGLAIDIYCNDNGSTDYSFLNYHKLLIMRLCDKYGLKWGLIEWGWDAPHFMYTNGHNIEDIINNPSLIDEFIVYKPKTMRDFSNINKETFELMAMLPEYLQGEVEGRGNGDCVPYNLQFCGAMSAIRNYPNLNITVDHTFDERLRKFLGKREDSTGGILVESIKKKLEEDRDSYIDCDAGDCILRFKYKSITPIKNTPQTLMRKVKAGRPVLISMTYSSTRGSMILFDETPSSMPSKHQGTFMGLDDHGTSLWYDVTSERHIDGQPEHIKGMEYKLFETDGNLSSQGIYYPCTIDPEVILKD